MMSGGGGRKEEEEGYSDSSGCGWDILGFRLGGGGLLGLVQCAPPNLFLWFAPQQPISVTLRGQFCLHHPFIVLYIVNKILICHLRSFVPNLTQFSGSAAAQSSSRSSATTLWSTL